MQKRVLLKYYGCIALMGIVLAIGLNNILLCSNIAKYSKAYQEAADTIYSLRFWEQILYTGILIPIIEEIIFRGVIFRILRKWFPFVVVAIVSSLAFGIYHGNLVQFVYASLCGLFLAYLCEKFQSIFAPIVAHVIMNLTSCIMTEYQLFSWVFERTTRIVLITAICVLVFFILFVKIQKVDITKMLKKYCKE